MENLSTYVLLLVPLALIQLGLQIAAWIDIARRPRVTGGNKLVWVLVTLLGILGVVVYFAVGRAEEEET